MIKAVILAAGMGTRLRELITDKPKCMVHVNGRPIIGWQLAALLDADVKDITIVTGYHAGVLRDYVNSRFADSGIRFLHSEDYAQTNNMYSLWLTRQIVEGSDLLFMNADVAFDTEVIHRLIRNGASGVAVDQGAYNEESMKVTWSADARCINGISKEFTRDESLGSSIDVYYLKATDARVLYEECGTIITQEGQRRLWTELALHRLFTSGRLRMTAVDVSGLDWFEIDNTADLVAAETLFTASHLRRSPPKAYFLDLDGTLYLGTRNVPGAERFVAFARSQGARVVFLSNNSSKSHADYVRRLQGIGIPAFEDDILLSTDALGAHIQCAGITRAYIFGTRSMKSVLERYGVQHESETPQAVIVGYNNEFTYGELAEVALILGRHAVPYFVSHVDRVCPTEEGAIPDAGALVELLAITTGRRPQQAFGKPAPAFVQRRLASIGVRAEEAVMVGDRVYTDLALAEAAGMQFVGVLSGESTRKDFEGRTNLLLARSVGDLAERLSER